MALADLVVVMNHGRIEQAGTPHEVFNAPRTEFVARFMGGHNVIDTAATARSRCAPTTCLSAAPHRAGDSARRRVRDVEYQGTLRAGRPDAARRRTATLIAPTAARGRHFERDAAVWHRPAHGVGAHWAAADARRLAA